LGNLIGNVDINRAWESITRQYQNSAKESFGHNELKQHKSWFELSTFSE
jgi:hypothetical protein